MSEGKKSFSLLEVKNVALIFAGLALIFAAVFFVAPKFIGYGSIGGERMVIIDPIKISNAQRAYAAKIMFERNDGQLKPDSLSDLFQVSKKVQEIIKEQTKGKIVFVKQAIVSSNLPDITDEILKLAGLSTNPPTIDISKELEIAPTNYMGFMKQNERGK